MRPIYIVKGRFFTEAEMKTLKKTLRGKDFQIFILTVAVYWYWCQNLVMKNKLKELEEQKGE